jgi:hypothetical protein
MILPVNPFQHRGPERSAYNTSKFVIVVSKLGVLRPCIKDFVKGDILKIFKLTR